MNLQFLAPEWLFAAPALLGGLVILYFLKLKRREVTVSSTFLWKKALEDLRVNSPFQRLRMNILLLLQLLVLSFLILALSRPISSFSGLGGRDYAILIDRSGSMNATDGGKETRLERAVNEARRLVAGLSVNDRGLVVAFDDQVELLTALTDERGKLTDALSRIQPTDRKTRLRDALERVRGMLVGMREKPLLTILSDGRVGPTKDLGVPGGVEVRYIKVGDSGDNIGVIGLEVRRAFQGGEASRVFTTIANTTDATRKVGVDCFLEGELITSKECEVPGHGQTSVAFESPKLRTGRLRVQLDGQDSLPSDDSAYAVLREKKDVRVLLVSEGNPFLERALEGDPVVYKDANGRLPHLDPAQFVPDDPKLDLRAYDLVILDRVEPKALPPGNYMMVDAVPPFEGIRSKGLAPWPQVVDWDEAHPIARFVALSSLDPTVARMVEIRKQDKAIVTSTRGEVSGVTKPKRRKNAKAPSPSPAPGADEAPEAREDITLPLVFEARDGDRHCLVLTFDLMKTQSWPLKAAFPIFLANAVRWLGGAGRDEHSLGVLTGEVAEIPIPKGATRAVILDPTGRERSMDLKGQDDLLRYPETSRAGFYEVRFDVPGSEAPVKVWFAANLCSAEESDILPAASLELENLPVKAEGKAQEPRREAWKIVALLAFAILLFEWWVYNRRVYV